MIVDPEEIVVYIETMCIDVPSGIVDALEFCSSDGCRFVEGRASLEDCYSRKELSIYIRKYLKAFCSDCNVNECRFCPVSKARRIKW